MPTLAAKASATRQASFFFQKPSPLLAPVILAPYASFRHKDAIANGCKKIFEARSTQSGTSIVASKSNLPALPKCSIRASVGSAHRQLHACASKGNLASSLSASSTSLFGDQDSILHGIPSLPRRQKSLKAPNAYKNDFFKFKQPVLTEKPEWWWRTLACVPYLIALQISYTGYFLQPFVEHYDKFGDLIYFVPGAITRLPPWFTMVYSYFIYIGVVKNKEWPHFFRFHVMMGMLLEILLQVIWTTCNFFPLIHYDGKFGMYFWAGVGLAYIVTSLQCISCALAGGYAHLPFVSDASYIHTLFNIGGFQRPF